DFMTDGREDGEAAAAAGTADVIAEADVHRRVSDFLTASGPVGPGRRQLANFLLAELLAERRGWQRLLTAALAEVERLRRGDAGATGPAAKSGEEVAAFAIADEFSETGDEEFESGLWLQPATRSLTDMTSPGGSNLPSQKQQRWQQQLLAEAAAARHEADEACQLGQRQRRLIEEMRRTLGRLEARLAQLTEERRRCLDLLGQRAGAEDSGVEAADLVQMVVRLIESTVPKELKEDAEISTMPPPPPTPLPPPQRLPTLVLSLPPAPSPPPPPQQPPSKPLPRQLRFPYPSEAPLPRTRRRQPPPLPVQTAMAAAAASNSCGKRRCLRCRRSFRPAENGPAVCRFHSLGQLPLTMRQWQQQQQQQQQQHQLAWACC
uniref:C2H2-type domain-containing protein n=1 Tax=Macrostomum lignano TaxID=282301 RepID=A0A1I8HTM3_9PLAT